MQKWQKGPVWSVDGKFWLHQPPRRTDRERVRHHLCWVMSSAPPVIRCPAHYSFPGNALQMRTYAQYFFLQKKKNIYIYIYQHQFSGRIATFIQKVLKVILLEWLEIMLQFSLLLCSQALNLGDQYQERRKCPKQWDEAAIAFCCCNLEIEAHHASAN